MARAGQWRRIAALEEFVSADFVDHTPLPGLPSDLEGMRIRLAVLHQAFPDFQSTILDVTAEDDKVVVLVRSSGTHKNSFLGEVPSGRRWEIMEIHILRVAHSQLVEHWGIPDFFGMLQQLGMVTAPWQTTASETAVGLLADRRHFGWAVHDLSCTALAPPSARVDLGHSR